jgi:hypothetical protein
MNSVEKTTHEIRQVDYQLRQLHDWIAPVLREIDQLKCWRTQLLELREHFERQTVRVTKCPAKEPGRTCKPVPKDPTLEKLESLSPAQLAALMAMLETDA